MINSIRVTLSASNFSLCPISSSSRLFYLSPLSALSLFSSPSRFAGHSHWQNVKHTKLAKSNEKGRLKVMYSKLVAQAVKDGNGCRDPRVNSKLASVLEDAKRQSIPSSILTKIMNSEETGDPFFIEIQGPNGIFIVVESTAAKHRHERDTVSAVVKKFGCKVNPNSGTIIRQMFRHFGYILTVGGSNSTLPNIDSATEVGIDVGATDVREVIDKDKLYYEFECEPSRVFNIQRVLESKYNAAVIEAEDQLEPHELVMVDPELRLQINTLVDRLRERCEYIIRVFDNICEPELETTADQSRA